MPAALTAALAGLTGFLGAVLALWRYASTSRVAKQAANAALVGARSADWSAYTDHLEARIDQLHRDQVAYELKTGGALERIGAKLDRCEEDRVKLTAQVVELIKISNATS